MTTKTELEQALASYSDEAQAAARYAVGLQTYATETGPIGAPAVERLKRYARRLLDVAEDIEARGER